LFWSAYKKPIDFHAWVESAGRIPESGSVQWLEEGLAWIVQPSSDQTAPLSSTAKIEFLFQTLIADSIQAHRVLRQIETTLLRLSWTELFISTGEARPHSFVSALLERLFRQVLPASFEDEDARPFLHHHLVGDQFDAIFSIPPGTWNKWIKLWQSIKPLDTRVSLHFRKSVIEAIAVLSCNMSRCMADENFRRFHCPPDLFNSPFLRLLRSLDHITAEDAPEKLQECVIYIAECEGELRSILRQLEHTGVSLDLVYLISSLEVTLKRLRTLVKLIWSNDDPPVTQILGLVAELVEIQRQSRSVRAFLAQQLDLFLRSIVERSGNTGERYIARTLHEYVNMVRSAAGGGLITCFTSVFKSIIGHAHFPLFFEGLFTWINYSGSFLLMQFCHFTLASKQPAMTAPALAARLKDLSHQDQLFKFVQQVAQLTRSQFAAALGNVGAVIPSCLVFDAVYVVLTGRHVFNLEYSQNIFDSLNPVTSLTLPFAIMTGILLWSSSLIAGSVENWTVYRRIPNAIAKNRRLREAFGDQKATDLGDWFARNIAGIASNVAIGFLLAFVPVFGKFFGLSLEVRHITLSAGTWAFAVAGSYGRLIDPTVIWSAFVGVIIIGALNITVSFSMALFVAIRARRLQRRWLRALGEAVMAYIRVRPFDFFFPPRSEFNKISRT
jgi:site-specific recombinase